MSAMVGGNWIYLFLWRWRVGEFVVREFRERDKGSGFW